MIPLHIVFRHFSFEERSQAESFIHKMATNLACFKDYVMGCRVVCDAPHRHHKNGNQYRIRVILFVPGKMIVVGNSQAKTVSHDHPYDAVSNAFKSAYHQLRCFVDKKKRGRSHWRKLNGETIPLIACDRV